LSPLKEEHPALKEVYSKVLQMVNYTLWSNIRALSETKKNGRKIGKLRFKSAARYRTLNYNQSGFTIDCEGEFITFSKDRDHSVFDAPTILRRGEGCLDHPFR